MPLVLDNLELGVKVDTPGLLKVVEEHVGLIEGLSHVVRAHWNNLDHPQTFEGT